MRYNLNFQDDFIITSWLCGQEYAFCPALGPECCTQDYANL